MLNIILKNAIFKKVKFTFESYAFDAGLKYDKTVLILAFHLVFTVVV